MQDYEAPTSSNREKPRKHSHKRHYTFMIITDEAGQGIRQFTLSHVPALVLVYSVFALSLVILCFMIYAGIYIHRSSSMKRELTAQVAHLTSENKKLSKENSELHDEADQLMVAVNNYRSAEEKAAKTEEEMKIPSGFPLSSSAQMKAGKDNPNGTGKEDGKESGNPIVIFTASVGSQIIASGSGTVQSVTDDAEYGHTITIDHGNGYLSIYRNAGSPLVKAGATVQRGDALFMIGTKNTNVGYQIQKDDQYVNPEEIIDING